MRPLILLLTACDFSASSTILSDDTARDSGSSQGEEDSGDPGDSGSASSEDLDGDGYTVDEGDCDDENGAVHPGRSDDCDGVDSDCDGQLDEDAVDSDGYEPNDEEGWSLGTMSDNDSYTLEGSLHNDDDVDLFDLTIDDSVTNLFKLQIALSDIPQDAVFELELTWLNEEEDLYSEAGTGSLDTTYDDYSLVDESGDYRIQVRSLGGADCSDSYTLRIDYTEWGW